ncbi:hypothetical protein ACFFWD_10830 [Bradyrhizobium erythrophlei]|uniref:hypothetical protein n=1 Tax=Bradyrhizobium erythrophlei TaxID=1437360 RepID=UPI0035E80366
MIRVFVAAEGIPACLPASPILSPELADMVLVLRFRRRSTLPVCISGEGRIPTAAFYNRYKQRRRILDHPVTGT